MSTVRSQILAAIEAAFTHPRGVSGVMEDAEIAIGARIIPLGSERPIPFPREDWARGVISMRGMEIRIVAIEAQRSGNGAFRRLIDSIVARGFVPVVLAPIGETMPAIMRRWGWQRQVVGEGFNKREEWRP